MKQKFVTVAAKPTKPTKPTKASPPPPPPPPPVRVGQVVWVSVLPKADIIGVTSDASPKLFASQESAQADCDSLNKTRHPSSQFVVREMRIES